jgi:S-adenosylmethionine:tRNA ribosyltransferase-isomerase
VRKRGGVRAAWLGTFSRVPPLGIHHVGVAVADLGEALETYRRLFDADVEHRATVPEQGVTAASLLLGAGRIELLEPLGEGRWRLRLEGEPGGEAPLPPYIREPLADFERYQTVYAEKEGSAAAPTAGLHFTPELLERLEVERVTLHVGLDTFRPISVDDLAEHELHSERYEVLASGWERIRAAARVLAVGTTSVRVLESLARGAPLAGRTDLFVVPGFEFRCVDALLTNFHLPRSTLLALVMAFAGVEETRRLYRLAIEERYRFYSFGDAMLVL